MRRLPSRFRASGKGDPDAADQCRIRRSPLPARFACVGQHAGQGWLFYDWAPPRDVLINQALFSFSPLRETHQARVRLLPQWIVRMSARSNSCFLVKPGICRHALATSASVSGPGNPFIPKRSQSLATFDPIRPIQNAPGLATEKSVPTVLLPPPIGRSCSPSRCSRAEAKIAAPVIRIVVVRPIPRCERNGYVSPAAATSHRRRVFQSRRRRHELEIGRRSLTCGARETCSRINSNDFKGSNR